MTTPLAGQVQHSVVRYRQGEHVRTGDLLAVEEPLEIRVQWEADGRISRESVSITMRTPGADFDLAAGFLLGESVISRREDIVDISYCHEEGEPQPFNTVTVTLAPGLTFDPALLARHILTSASCGICGKAALDALQIRGCRALPPGCSVSGTVVRGLPAALHAAQPLFNLTGGLHAAGLFDTEGKLLSVAEDVGRHNALDKLIGERLLHGAVPLQDTVLQLSGRVGFELVQKAVLAGIPVVAAVGAPSSLAVELAETFNLTLVGFVQPDGFNVYTGQERLAA